MRARRVFYSGQVQGVGFRATASRLARQFPISGYVRNLEDGRVELLAEGEPEDLDRFLQAVGRAMAARIEQVTVVEEPAGTESLGGFSIRYD